MKILNLYAGIGGNRKLWQGVDVTAVEMDEKIAELYKSLYPNDTVIVGDAHQYLIEHMHEYDGVWSSPPCQSHTKMVKFTRHKKPRYVDMTLYQEILLLQNFYKGWYVVENVQPYYKPMIEAKKIGRHLFWSNFDIAPSEIEIKSPKNFVNLTTVDAKRKMMDWLGIHYEQNIYYGNNHCPVQILRNAVHPKIGLHILNQAISQHKHI